MKRAITTKATKGTKEHEEIEFALYQSQNQRLFLDTLCVTSRPSWLSFLAFLRVFAPLRWIFELELMELSAAPKYLR